MRTKRRTERKNNRKTDRKTHKKPTLESQKKLVLKMLRELNTNKILCKLIDVNFKNIKKTKIKVIKYKALLSNTNKVFNKIPINRNKVSIF